MVRAEGFGLKTITAITGEPFELVCYTFVDDTDRIHCLPAGNHDTEQLVKEMQSMIDHWAGGIRATGGALVPSKSYWFLMSFYWQNDRWHYRSMESTPGTISIKDTNGHSQVLERLDVNEARETLGTWIAMDGSQEEQYEALEDKIISWGNKIRGKALTRTNAFLSLRTSLSKSLEYPLAACTIERSKLKQLTRLLMKIVLPTLGIPKSFPRVLLHAPDLSMGYQFPCLDTEAGFYQVEVLLRNITDHRLTGKLLRDTYETFQLELGVGCDPLCLPFHPWKTLATDCWIKKVWQFCEASHLKVRTPATKIRLLREGDCFLTTLFVNNGYKGEELRLINLCRKWHRVLRLSEVVTGQGNYIRQDARRDEYPIGTNLYDWAEEERPSSRCWTLWNDALEQCLVSPSDKRMQLVKPLGKWLQSPPSWQWWYSPTDDRIFKSNQGSIKVFVKQSRRTRRPRCREDHTVDVLPTSALPTICFGSNTVIRHEGYAGVIEATEERITEWWERKVLRTGRNCRQFFEGIANGSAAIICDGSFKDDWGTAALIALPDMTSTSPVVLVHLTPGPKETHSPYRAELAGILASVLFVETESTQYGVYEGTVTVGCDCETALRTYLYCRQHLPAPKSPHFDLTSQLYDALHTSRFTWKGRDIAGHQDDVRPYHRLDVWEKWNVEADLMAKMHWANYPEHGIPFYNLPPRNEPSISCDSFRFTSWDKTELYRYLFEPGARDYLAERFEFDNIESIDLESMGRAFKSTIMHKRLWLSKFLTNRLPTMENIAKWTQDEEPDICPRCGEVEDSDHITWCQDSGAMEHRHTRIDNLADTLVAVITAPGIRERIVSMLTEDTESTPLDVEEIPITPELLTKGFIPLAWTESQQQYYLWLKRRTTGKRWATRLIKELWEIAWDMWNHRKKIEKSPQSLLHHQRHANADHLIQNEYDLQLAAPNHRLRRWFSRPLEEVVSHDIHFKLQWLEVVSSLRQRYIDNR